ncbi:coiled-coil domain-containing protein 106 [Etheostoma spectabile]|uniref:coiled-coil domain-containing protein 106 n=2 Tax=Etheostoma spectabile TaxID=54343 RepID=UPI0013AFB7D2|nr:coiled-coil domain-containing protein 106-like [Etheostoma spectabile]
MDNVEKNKKGMRTRGKKKTEGMNTLEEIPVISGSAMAPTAQLGLKQKSNELEMFKLRVEWQKEKIAELTKERDYLKDQLASALKKDDKGSIKEINLSSDSSGDSPVESSSDMSDSSSSSSEEDKIKKRKKKGKGKKYRKKSKKIKPKTRQRAQTPDQVVDRYKRILRKFSKGGTMSAAFKHVGVDRNTVVVNAPIAELFIAAPGKYKEILKNHNNVKKLSVFATQCATAIQEDQGIEDTITAYKASGKLLPLKKK